MGFDRSRLAGYLTGTPFEAPTVPVGRDAAGAAPPPKPTDG